MLAGTSFKHEHLCAILTDPPQDGFFEVHAENYMGAGGPPHRMLTALREHHALSLHGVCLSIGGPGALDQRHLARFRDLVLRYQPALVSEHLAWSSHGGTFFNDLLPLPYTHATLERVCEHIDQVQQAIGRPLLLENPATYVAFASSTMSEAEFIAAVARRTGCDLLLDVNNVFVSATNHGYSAADYLDAFPLERVGEIHLAGHSLDPVWGQTLLIDSHDTPVADVVWDLHERLITRIGARSTLIERDGQVPAFSRLLHEQTRAALALALVAEKAPT